MKTRTMLTAAAVLLIGSPAIAQTEIPLIPREIIFGSPNKASPQISPDGDQLSYLAPVNGVLNVWVGPAQDPDLAEPVTTDAAGGIRVYQWAYTGEHIIYLQDEVGDGSWRLHCVDVTSGKHIPLTPNVTSKEGYTVSARIQHVSPQFPRDIIVGLNDRDQRYHDLYVVNIDTGDRVELQRNDEYLAFFTDNDFSIRVAAKLTPDGGNELCAMNAEGEWEVFTTIPMEDLFSTGPLGFDKTGDFIYMIDSRGRDTAALKSIDLRTGAGKTLAKDRDADISGGVLIHPTERIVQAAAATYKRREWHIIDSSVKNDFKYLESVADGELSVLSRTLDDSQWVVAYEMDTGPVRYYRYDRPSATAYYLFSSRSQLEGLPFAKMHDEVIKSRDRMSLVSYYTLPIESDPRGKGRPTKPLATVLWVHGGPWARDFWGFEPVHQWLASRGYAVLSVNYRGSTGFGKKFVNAGNGEWGGKMHDDLIDAVEWAVKKKIADPDRIAIMGGSYGGYASLVGLGVTPDTFACGIDIVGPANLVTFLEAIPHRWQPTADLWATRVGDIRTEDGRSFLMQRSPITSVERITKPLLIAHGGNDPQVRRSETDQIVETLQGKGIPVTYVVYPDEGHGITRAGNRLSLFAVIESFLGEHLGGKVQPVGTDFDESSIKIPVGGEKIAGVSNAMFR